MNITNLLLLKSAANFARKCYALYLAKQYSFSQCENPGKSAKFVIFTIGHGIPCHNKYS